MNILEANWAKIHVAFLFATLLGLSSCSVDTSDAPSSSRPINPSTPIEVSEDFKREESSMLEENHGKDDDMDLTKMESIRELNEQNTLSLQLKGTGIREVVIDLSLIHISEPTRPY